ncbi:MAG: hypothetical protein JW776_05565 [Candidatus Lokiarchaeota archaeon]|nr:hypothetical protein [Candidatus Lokiarchaeota archaeon]
MKTTKKTAIGLFLFLFLLSMTTAKAATPDWGVRGGDIIRWDATHYIDAPYLTYPITLEWYIIFTVYGFPEFNGMPYINGSVNQNGTIIDDPASLSPITLRSLGSSPGNFIGDVLDDIHLGTNLISDSTELADLKAGFQWLETNYPAFSFTETTPKISFKFTGSGSESSYDWTYSCVVNYTSDHVLYSVDENYYEIDTEEPGLGEEAFEDFIWRRTSYTHGTGEEAPNGDTPPPGTIPGYGFSILFASMIIGTVILIRKFKKI